MNSIYASEIVADYFSTIRIFLIFLSPQVSTAHSTML